MKRVLSLVGLLSAIGWPAGARAAGDTSLPQLERLFASPPDDSRIMMRWWWFGPAVTKPQLERELRAMKDAGIGGFEVQPVYPVALDDPTTGFRNLPFLSPEFLDALGFTAAKAADLGMRFDLTLGSGWPYGGPQVPITQAAGKLRVERVKPASSARRVPWPAMGAGERPLAAFAVRAAGDGLDTGGARELADAGDGFVSLPTPAQAGDVVLFFLASRTGMQVKRAAVGAEGYVLDHYDRAAIDAYLAAVGEPLLRAAGDHPPHAIFCDSLEVYDSDWTSDFLAEFRGRRGFDLRPHLPALVAGSGAKTAELRHDWAQTLTELLQERFLAPLHEWAGRHRTLLRLQGYGVPPAAVSSNALADLAEGEGWQWKTLRPTRWASSANHVYGRPVTSSETWTWLHSPSFRATPLDLKAEADLHFLQGVNQIIGHGWPYTTDGVAYPGWRFYASGAFDEANPWWIAMPDLARYLQRVSFLLRQGEPANDVALYLPNDDAWSELEPGRIRGLSEVLARHAGAEMAQALDAGFGLDFFDDRMLRDRGRVGEGLLSLGDHGYRVVVLPGVERIPPATLQALEEFARKGGVLVATRRIPDRAPGFLASEADALRTRSASQRLFGAGGRGRFVADESRLGTTLAGLLRPDVQLQPAAPEIGFVHRRTATADVYFLANTTNERKAVRAVFRTGRRHAEWWDPMDGRVLPASMRVAKGGGAAVELDLEPYGSRVLVFSDRALASRPPARPSRETGTIELSRGWKVSFGTQGKSVAMDALRSWTEDESTRFYSGTATYERTVSVPAALLAPRATLRLQLGNGERVTPVEGARFRAWLDSPVREAAVVYVNDRRAGAIWCPPFALDVTGFVKPGENSLRIVVGNLAHNAMAARPLPDYRLLRLRYGPRFEDQDLDKLQVQPAGLLGPVQLIATVSR